MPKRNVSLVNGEFYHICTKSIAGFKIFNAENDFSRMVGSMKYYQLKSRPFGFSRYLKLCCNGPLSLPESKNEIHRLVHIIAFCIMKTHIHLLLRQCINNGISDFMKLLLNSYSKYFNKKHNRKGPLWEARFCGVRITNDDHLLQVTRYIHLNPTTAGLTDLPENWKYSSYNEYVSNPGRNGICTISPYLDIDGKSYAKFVNDHIGHQKQLAAIKHLLLEEAHGKTLHV